MVLKGVSCIKKLICFIAFFSFSFAGLAQGTWSTVTTLAPDVNGGVMLLLSDGTVMVKTYFGGFGATPGPTWDKLTPAANGSYASGTWSRITPMAADRLYFSSWLLNDGRVYVGGGEYGAGSDAEIYNPVTNTWSAVTPAGPNFSDGVSENLPDGRILHAATSGPMVNTYIYDPVTNAYTSGPSCLAPHAESAWLKLADSSILQVDIFSTNSERYIPTSNTWVADASVPVALYDSFGFETGGAVLLPDGRGFFVGSTGHTAYYTPSGDTTPGSWAAGPDVPGGQGSPDAPMAMMNNGKVLLIVSPAPTVTNHFPSPTAYYEFDYLTNTYTALGAPSGGSTVGISAYLTNLLVLPDGNILYCSQGARRYFLYTPTGSPLLAGKPSIDSIFRNACDTFTVTGKLFTGISEGACYGDDWAMSTNFPLVRLSKGASVYYARTYNWNRYGSVMNGTLPDTLHFVMPAGIPTGTYAMQVVVNGNPSDTATFNNSLTITPASFSICAGATQVLTDSASIGVWSSSNTGIATVGSSTGLVTGIGAGTANITYSIGSCFRVATVTVNPLPSSLTGSTSICLLSTSTLGLTPGGGVWVSGNGTIAGVGSATGIVSGNAAGTTSLTYTLPTGCSLAVPVSVNPLPASIAGSGVLCIAQTTTLTNATAGGSWTSGSAGIASVSASTGLVTGVSAGTAVITYTLTTGCYATIIITVNPLPAAISGTLTVCPAGTTSLSDAGGGTWSSGSPGIASIGSATGIATGNAPGTSIITYTLPTGCSVNDVLTVNSNPAAISGTATVCTGSPTTLSGAGGGTWASVTPGVATIGSASGIVSGLSAGTTVISYTLPTGCYVTGIVTVNPLPSAISGAGTVCIGSTTTLTNSGGGTWTSGSSGVANIGSATGVVSGVSIGTSTITYTLSTGCSSTSTITVNPLPAAIAGATSLYLGTTITLTDVTVGGSWSGSAPLIATIGTSSGVVSAVSAGTSTISYTLPTGCLATTTVTVINAPAPITGAGTVCQSSSISFSSISTGGTWTSSNAGIASVGSASGIVTGVSVGSATITYTIAGTFVTKSVTVNPTTAPITGLSSVCIGATTTLSNITSGGVWSSSNTAIATIGSASGVVNTIASGSVTISYLAACGVPVTYAFSVNPLPSIGAISGANGVCVGSIATFTDTTAGGVWSMSSATATIGSSTGVVTGLAISGTTISYTASNAFSCVGTVTKPIYVQGPAGIISTFSGTGTNSYTGDGGPAYLATIQGPRDIATDGSGNVYLCDITSNVIRKITVSGIITTIAGTGAVGNGGDGGPATAATFSSPNGIYVDNTGNIFIANTNSQTIRKIAAGTGVITTVAGTAGVGGASGDGGPATAAKLSSPLGLCGDLAGNLYICDQGNYKIRKIAAGTGVITTIAGTGSNSYSGDGGPATAARLSTPRGVVLDRSGNLYIADGLNAAVRKIALSTGIISTVAGTGITGSAGDGGPATAAQLNGPSRLAFDGGCNLYVADMLNNKVRMVNLATKIITTVAGTGTGGYSGDAGAATAAKIFSPCGVAYDNVGNLYISDASNRRIRVAATLGSIGISLVGPGSVPVGTPITFNASASITTGVSYQWQKNGVNVGSGSTTYTNSSPVNGDVYRCILAVVPACGSAFNDTSNSITVNVFGAPPIDALATTETSVGQSLNLYPNPAQNSFRITGTEMKNGGVVITITDQLGKIVLTRNVNVDNNNLNESLNIESLPAAVYLVSLTDVTGITSRWKLVKN